MHTIRVILPVSHTRNNSELLTVDSYESSGQSFGRGSQKGEVQSPLLRFLVHTLPHMTDDLQAELLSFIRFTVVNTNEKGYAQIQFQNVASVMAIRLPAPATDTYSKLVIHPNGTDFYSKGIANMTDGLIQPTESTNIMTLSFGSEGITVNEGDLISLYMFVAPVDMSNSNLTFTLYSAEPGAPPYESITTKGKTMLPGKAYLYDLTNREVPYVTFTASAEQTMHLSQEVPSLEYSVNEGTWTTLGTNTVTFGDTKGTLRLRGKSQKVHKVLPWFSVMKRRWPAAVISAPW